MLDKEVNTKKIHILVFILVALIVFVDLARCEPSLLLLPPSARLKAGEFLAVTSGGAPSSMLVNPAALLAGGKENTDEKFCLEGSMSPGFMGDDFYYYAGFSRFIKKANSPYFTQMKYGLMIGHYDGGKLEYYDQWGMPRVISVGQNDYVISLGVGASLKSDRNLSVGGNLKLYYSTLIERFSTNAMMFDMGAVYKDESYFVGGALKNLGTKLQYNFTEESLPLALSVVGGMIKKNYIVGMSFDYFLEGSYNKNIMPVVGGEFYLNEILSIRGRYKLNSTVEGLALGFGINLKKQNLKIDYTLALNQTFYNTYHITLTYLPSY